MASEQRLHPLSIVFTVVGQLANLILPGALLVFTARKVPWDRWLILLSIPTVLYGLVRYLTFRYRFEPDEMVIRSGLLFRNERHIRYDRIHNIETVRNLLHRLLGVADARVQTAGGSEPEARLQVLSLDAIEDMRRRVFEGRASAADVAAPAPSATAGDTAPALGALPYATPTTVPEQTLVRLSARDLIVFGLVENRGLLVIAAALGLLWESQFMNFSPGPRSSIIGDAIRFVLGGGWSSFALSPDAVLRLVGLAAGLFVLVRVLSVGWALVRLHNFTLTRAGDELRTSCGLVTELRGAIPLHRIQLVTVSEAPLQRLFRRSTVRVQTAGGDAEASVTREWLAPILKREQVSALLAEVLPGDPLASMDWRPLHPRAYLRLLRGWLWTCAIVVIPAVYFFRAWGLALAPPLLLLAWLGARGQARGCAYALGSDLVGFRSGWLWKHTSFTRYSKFQSVAIEHSPFDRRWGMATVSGDTAGGGAHRITIPYLPAAEAHATCDLLKVRVAATEFRW